MNFLKKKDSPELSFKEPEEEIPIPPNKVLEETIPEPTTTESPETFTDHKEFMPEEQVSENEPGAISNEAEHTISKQSVGEEQTIPDQLGEGAWVEQTNPEPTAEMDKQATTEQPFVELDDSVQAAPDEPVAPLTLPDLPELPQKTVEDSVGVIATPEEVPPDLEPEAPNEQVVSESPITVKNELSISFEEPNESQEATVEAPSEEVITSPEATEPSDPYPEDTDAAYLPEEQEETEHYVDAHEFYEVLLDIKAMKKRLREQDMDMRSWEEVDDRLENKTASVLGNIDTIQENLIKIDTTLFEG